MGMCLEVVRVVNLTLDIYTHTNPCILDNSQGINLIFTGEYHWYFLVLVILVTFN